jgi:hypothetical protein
MPRMLDMIRNSQVPSNLMQSAARGALSVPPEETIEILVYLALHHKLFGEQARLTLAGWDEKSSAVAAGNPKTSSEVLGYFVSPENLRTCLLPTLAENPAVGEESLDQLAVSGTRSVVEVLLASERVMNSSRLLQALQVNANLLPNELGEVGTKLAALEAAAAEASTDADAPDEVIETTIAKFLEENAVELEAVKDDPFHPIGISVEDVGSGESGEVEAQIAAAAASASPDTDQRAAGKSASPATNSAPAAAIADKARKPLFAEAKRDSSLQKISKLDIRGRIMLAMRGNKEERAILIRDSTKLVSMAVLDSPKISEAEVEKIALQRNVLEAVLRAIPMKRKFAKNYNITRNLVQNPRTPLDLALGLMKNLLVHDLKNLTGNKEISDTIRKVATRMYRQKTAKKG